MDASLKKFLQDHKLECLVPDFEEARVLDLGGLHQVMMQRPILDTIVKSVVPRATLLNLSHVVVSRLSKESSQAQEDSENQEDSLSEDNTDSQSVIGLTQGVEPYTRNPHLTPGVVIEIDGNISQEDISQILQNKSPSASPPAKRQRKSDLLRYLESKVLGKLVLKQAEQYSLENSHRSRLADLVIEREFNGSTNKEINAARFRELAEEIVEIFPTEDQETFYVPASTPVRGKHLHAKGKLYDTYTNFCKELRKVGLRQIKSNQAQLVSSLPPLPEGDVNDLESKLEFLKTRLAPWDRVENYWAATAAFRLNRLAQSVEPQEDVCHYLNLYRCLKSPRGYTLLESDFSVRYEDASNRLFSHWTDFSCKVKRELSKKSITAVSDAEVLVNFAQLFSVTTISSNQGKKPWRPSREEVSTGFVSHVKDPKDIDRELESIYRRAEEKGFTVQPFPMIVGENLDNISASYFVLEKIYFKVDSPLHAFEVAFKSYFALNCEYPAPSSKLWFVVQKTLFDIHVPSDRVFKYASNQDVKHLLKVLKV